MVYDMYLFSQYSITILKGLCTYNTANKHFSAGYHEQKNEKTTSQIKFLTVTIKQEIKLVLWHSLFKGILVYWFECY